jgi:molybdopterin-containing oxidoreductase family iron-sulfur binding subunit
MTGKQHWRSLGELSDSPRFRAFLESEFPPLPEAWSASSRRQFLKVMGASLGLAGLTGCRWPKETIVPFASRPENRIPGVPVQYATAMELGGYARPLLVRSYDGRPIKIEGNNLHPFLAQRGRADALAQAAILDMYDPDRSVNPLKRQDGRAVPRTWGEFLAETREPLAKLRAAGGDGLLIVSQASSSPTLAALRERLHSECPKARWFEYEPVSFDNEREGTRIALGAPHRTWLKLDAADLVVSFDDDFLMSHPAAVRYTGDFAAARARADTDRTMNRLVVIESNYSVTGSKADHRFAERASDVPVRLCQLAAELLKKGLKLPPAAATIAEALKGFDAGALQARYLPELADDLLAHAGRVLISVGPRQPAEAHAVAALLNGALGATGKTVAYIEAADAARPTHAAAIAALAQALGGDGRKMVLVLNANPVFDAPAELNFAELLSRHDAIHLGLYADETAAVSGWHVNAAHFLESWGDARAWDGTLSIVQPLIAPLYDGKTAVEMLAHVLGDEKSTAYELVRGTHSAAAPAGTFETWWQKALHDGFVEGSAARLKAPGVAEANWAAVLDSIRSAYAPPAEGEFELVFAPDYKVYDGRFANNGWLQELPDPITKLTWDNAAYISPADARRLNVRSGDFLEVAAEGRTLRIPAYVLPGHARGSVTLPLGYGRRSAGVVAKRVGFDTYSLRTASGPAVVRKASVKRGRGSRELATTQDHHAIDSALGRKEMRGRVPELAREGTLGEYKRNPKFVETRAHIFPLHQLFAGADYSQGPRWAMAIDLARCTGCSACVVACQAENNVPVVGREEVLRGREMSWIRIDRYFTGDPESDEVGVIHQPLACQHCENAPCEQVCPVAATVHDSDGLNVMVYNRCIGTRYCSNNCPYKVRRFNWFYNHHGPKHPRSGGRWLQTKLTDIEKLGNNPDVTVRSRGVMEKCTFCVQRINAVKIDAKNNQREIRDGEILTACQQTCPADAIVFGDLNDPSSAVSKLFGNDRAYELLQHLNVRTRNRYLANLKNPVREPEHPAEHAQPHGSGHGAAEGHAG